MLRAVTILLKRLFALFQTCDSIKDANCCCSVASLVLEPALRYTAYWWCIWSVLWNKLAKYSRFRSTRIKLLAAYEGLDIFFRKNLYVVDLISWSRSYMETILQYWCKCTSSYMSTCHDLMLKWYSLKLQNIVKHDSLLYSSIVEIFSFSFFFSRNPMATGSHISREFG